MRKLVLLLALAACGACVTQPAPNDSAPAQNADAAFKTAHDRYVVEFLRRNPTVNTYLGGAALDPSLKDADGRLRDHSPAALAEEDRWLSDTQKTFEGFDAQALSPARRIDREVALAQIRFLLRQHQTRRYQERAVDTYASDPFRAVDWQLQGMTQTGPNSYGTADEWRLVAARLADVPRFLSAARAQIEAGVKSGNTADWRMLLRDGVNTSEANARYFAEEFPKLAEGRIALGEASGQLLSQVKDASSKAADAYRQFGDFFKQTFFDQADGKLAPKEQFKADRFAAGEEEYNWAVRNNLRMPDAAAASLYDGAMAIVDDTRKQMVEVARAVGAKRGLKLPEDGDGAVRAVFDELGKDYPKDDDEMVAWYRETCFRVVDYARRTGVFDVPADYKLDVTITPPPLRSSIEGAAYYPAPPFKTSGVGRFYVSPAEGDVELLKENNRAALADLAVHEGFPGHDWHYKVLAQYKNDIAPVRWLTPGAVEDSSSMWQDSMASEGWGLYAEALMAEPAQGAPEGFYTPEERLYQLKGKLYRDLRVRIDTGLHTGRMSYDDAVTLFSEVVDFLPGRCNGDGTAAAGALAAKAASCKTAEGAIFRYSKWPTQAITYRLGKDQIYALREEARRAVGSGFSPKEFHLLFMRQGTIPSGYFREELLKAIQKK